VRRDAGADGAGAVALAWGLALAVATYALVRAVEAILLPVPSPAAMAWSLHCGFFWRIWTAAYVGGFGAFVVFAAARRDPRRAAGALPGALIGAALLLAAQALLFP